jgi:ribosomal protein S18 acetylase RimI-like enzyme
MDRPTIHLRAAKPDLDDGRLFARYLDQAAEGFFRFLLGRRKEDILAAAFVEPGHDLSHENVTFAERDGDVVGMISGYSAEQHRRSSDRPLRDAADRSNLRMMTVAIVFAPLLRALDSLADGDYYLQAVAVEPRVRGEGLGTLLMDFIEARAVEAGSGRLALDVSAKNEGARRLYERRGMVVESQWPKRLRIPGLKLLRMAKPLPDGVHGRT